MINKASYAAGKKKSRPLGFPCPDPSCKLELGSISLERQKNWWEKKERNRAKGRTHESYDKKPRIGIKQVEYSLENAITGIFVERFLADTSKGVEHFLLELRRKSEHVVVPDSYKQLLDYIIANRLPDVKRELESRVAKVKANLEEARQRQQQIIEDSKWDVIEKVENIDPPIYKLIMRIMPDRIVFSDENTDEDYKEKQEGKSNTTTTNMTTIIKWNPIKEIREYRKSSDPLRYNSFKFINDYFASRVAVKYPSLFTDYTQSDEKHSLIAKAFDVIDRYREPFSNKNWRYTWFEWLYIAIYAKLEGIGKAQSMLRALDGKKEGNMSHKGIEDRIEPTLKFWEDFIEYGPYFYEFLKKGFSLIENDQELKNEWNEYYVKNSEKNEKDIMAGIVDKHFKGFQLQQYINNNTNDNDVYFEITRPRPIRVRIYHHINPNYRKEMEEYDKGLRKEKPNRRRKVCGPFSLSQLPPNVIVQLMIDRRLKLTEIYGAKN